MGEGGSKAQREDSNQQHTQHPSWFDPVFVGSEAARDEELHPDLEQLQGMPTFRPLLTDGINVTPETLVVAQARPFQNLHDSLREHFTQLGLAVFHEQITLLREVDVSSSNVNRLFPDLQRQKQALVTFSQQLENVDEFSQSMAAARNDIVRLTSACESLRLSLPETESFPTFEAYLKERKNRRRSVDNSTNSVAASQS